MGANGAGARGGDALIPILSDPGVIPAGIPSGEAGHLRRDPGDLVLVQYRVEHHLSQTALARQLGMQQSAIARLEAGNHTPSLTTLLRLARGLGIRFHIDITPDDVALTA